MKYYTDTVILFGGHHNNCGENNECQFIIQYTCEGHLGVNIRDGHPQNPNGNTSLLQFQRKQIVNWKKKNESIR